MGNVLIFNEKRDKEIKIVDINPIISRILRLNGCSFPHDIDHWTERYSDILWKAINYNKKTEEKDWIVTPVHIVDIYSDIWWDERIRMDRLDLGYSDYKFLIKLYSFMNELGDREFVDNSKRIDGRIMGLAELIENGKLNKEKMLEFKGGIFDGKF